MTTLLLAEHDNISLNHATARALTAALQMGEVHLLVAGYGASDVAAQAAKLEGVSKVILADDSSLAHQLAEPLASLIVSLSGNYEAIAAPATATFKNALPRVAALLDVMQVSDITAVISPDTFERPIYAGNAIQTVHSTDAKKVITVRTASFQPAGTASSAPIELIEVPASPALSLFIAELPSENTRPELTSAKVVVSGGRALGSMDKFRDVIMSLADRLGAAVGASRAAVDAGFAPNDYQVGQTGKVVAPDLYIALGISGAIQHLAGMKDSKIIVAVNTDPEAPIFRVADFGIVGDLFVVAPELEREVAKLG